MDLSQAEAVQQAYVATLPGWVGPWMIFMTVMVNLSIPFVIWLKLEAIVVLIVAILTGVFALGFIMLFGEQFVGGFAQVVLWTPCVLFLIARRHRMLPPLGASPAAHPEAGANLHERIGRTKLFDTLYRGWLTVVLVMMIISLCFDWPNVIGRLTSV